MPGPPPPPIEFDVSVGSFALVGYPIASNTLAAGPAAFVLTGKPVDFGAVGTLMASHGTFATLGEDVDFTRTPPALNPQPVLFPLTGGTSSGSRLLSAATGTFSSASPPIAITPPQRKRWFGPSDTACVCDCCVLPHVNIEIVDPNVNWQVSGAITASLTYQCNNGTETVVPITLSGGAATGSLALGTGYCTYRIDATNACGPVSETARNYVYPNCDCLHYRDETPDKWARTPPVYFSISGSSSATGSGFCTGLPDCPTIGFSTSLYCPQTAKKYRLTKPTGCFSFNMFIEIGVFASWRSYPFPLVSGVDLTVTLLAHWYRKGAASSINYYPSLTEIIPANTPVAWDTNTVFGPRYIRAWTATIDSFTFIGAFPTIKCPSALAANFQSNAGVCRDSASGNVVTCDSMTCIPDLTVSATWG